MHRSSLILTFGDGTNEIQRDIEAGGDRFDRTLWTTLAEAGVLAG